jgi:hypothetical protein
LNQSNSRRSSAKIAAGAILCVIGLFLIVLIIGDPIASFGTKWMSFLYSFLAFIPIAVVCAYVFLKK